MNGHFSNQKRNAERFAHCSNGFKFEDVMKHRVWSPVEIL
jgi:hypothetical protein